MNNLYNSYSNLLQKVSFQPPSIASHFYIFHDLIANNTLCFQHKAICLLKNRHTHKTKEQNPGAYCILDSNITDKEMYLLWQAFWVRVYKIPWEKNWKENIFLL